MCNHRHSKWVIFLALASILASATGWADSKMVWSMKPEQGFIGDSMAFDAAESRFAYIRTDSSSFLEIVVIETSGFKKVATMKPGDPSMIPEDLVFSDDGKNLIFIWMDGYKGTRGAILFEIASGKVLKKIGPATYAKVSTFANKQVLTLTTTKTDAKGQNHFTITAHRTSDFKKIKGTKIVLKADLSLKRPPIRVLYWEPGHISVVGMQKGKYDKKRDIRLPEHAIRYNVLTKKITWKVEPKDIVQWTKATTMRPNHREQLRFLEVSDDLKTLQTISQNNVLGTTTTKIPWKLYEPKSLKQKESWDSKTLLFSMTIDPVNPDAVKRKKADKERMDLYRFDSGKATLLGQVLTTKRKFSWTAGKRFFSYLYKLKGFGRGGKEVKIFAIK